MVLDFFSNQEISSTISKRTSFLIPSNINFIEYFELFENNFFQTRNNLINENLRLKNEVMDLRQLRLENSLLREEIYSNQSLIESVDSFNYFFIKTTAILKNNENKYLISGGYDKNLEENDILINEEGFVVGLVGKIFQNHSEVKFISDLDFSAPGVDKYGNEYLIQNNGEELFVYSTLFKEYPTNIDFIFTNSKFGQPSKFPIVSLLNSELIIEDNKISSKISIQNINFSLSNIYIVKPNDLP